MKCDTCKGTGIDVAADTMVNCPNCEGTGERTRTADRQPSPCGFCGGRGQAQHLGPKCPGCSGDWVLTDDPQVLRCTRCGGVFTDYREPITPEQASRFVALHLPMKANAGPDGQFYFDLHVTPEATVQHLVGNVAGRRLHGWADQKTRRVVQWG